MTSYLNDDFSEDEDDSDIDDSPMGGLGNYYF